MSYSDSQIVLFDLETTGLDTENDRIIEISACSLFKDDKEISFLVNPGMSLPSAISRLTGITDEMLMDKPVFGDIISEFFGFCCGDNNSNKEVVLVAHNNFAFDKLFLENECKRAGIEIPTNITFIDSLNFFRNLMPKIKSHSLSYLCSHFELRHPGSHRALADAKALKGLILKALQEMPLDDFIKMAKHKPKLMPFGKYKGMPINSLPKDYKNWLRHVKITSV